MESISDINVLRKKFATSIGLAGLLVVVVTVFECIAEVLKGANYCGWGTPNVRRPVLLNTLVILEPD